MISINLINPSVSTVFVNNPSKTRQNLIQRKRKLIGGLLNYMEEQLKISTKLSKDKKQCTKMKVQ